MIEEGSKRNHDFLLSALIERMEGEVEWYENEVSTSISWWKGLSVLALIITLISSGAAAFMTKNQFEPYGRVLLVVLPILSAGATSLIQLFRFPEKEALRESGRIELSDIILNARSQLYAAGSEADYRKAFHAIRERYHMLEISQHNGYVAMHQDESSKSGDGKKQPGITQNSHGPKRPEKPPVG